MSEQVKKAIYNDNDSLLLISPSAPDLSVHYEIEWLTRLFRVDLLSGTVTKERVFSHIRGRSFRIIHVAAHGDSDGILLSNGEKMDMHELTALARAVEADLIYLNSCSSARLAQFLVDQGVPVVIAATSDIDDLQAWSMASTFYYALASGDDVFSAYKKASPTDGSLSIFSDGMLVSRQLLPIFDELNSIKWFHRRIYVIVLLICVFNFVQLVWLATVFTR